MSDQEYERACHILAMNSSRREIATLRARCERAEAEAARMRAEREWRPIAEAQDFALRIIMGVGRVGDPVHIIGEGYFDGKWRWSIDSNSEPKPTHFQRLPDMPIDAALSTPRAENVKC